MQLKKLNNRFARFKKKFNINPNIINFHFSAAKSYRNFFLTDPRRLSTQLTR